MVEADECIDDLLIAERRLTSSKTASGTCVSETSVIDRPTPARHARDRCRTAFHATHRARRAAVRSTRGPRIQRVHVNAIGTAVYLRDTQLEHVYELVIEPARGDVRSSASIAWSGSGLNFR